MTLSEGRHSTDSASALDSEIDQQVVRPSIGPTLGRLRDDDQTTCTDRLRSETQCFLARPETPRDHGGEGPGFCSQKVGRLPGNHLDTCGPPQPPDGTLQEIRAFRTAVEENHLEIGSIVGDHQAGDTPAGTQIQYSSRHTNESAAVRAGVFDHLGDGSLTEKAQFLGLSQDGGERCVGWTAHGSARASLRRARRRCDGSGPRRPSVW